MKTMSGTDQRPPAFRSFFLGMAAAIAGIVAVAGLLALFAFVAR